MPAAKPSCKTRRRALLIQLENRAARSGRILNDSLKDVAEAVARDVGVHRNAGRIIRRREPGVGIRIERRDILGAVAVDDDRAFDILDIRLKLLADEDGDRAGQTIEHAVDVSGIEAHADHDAAAGLAGGADDDVDVLELTGQDGILTLELAGDGVDRHALELDLIGVVGAEAVECTEDGCRQGAGVFPLHQHFGDSVDRDRVRAAVGGVPIGDAVIRIRAERSVALTGPEGVNDEPIRLCGSSQVADLLINIVLSRSLITNRIVNILRTTNITTTILVAKTGILSLLILYLR